MTSENRLQEALEDLPKEIQPRRDLWAGIEYELEQPQAANDFRWGYAMTGCFMLVICAFVFVPNWQQQPSDEQAEVPQVADLGLQMVEQFEEDKALLLTKYSDHPALAPDWRQQIDEMDASVQLILQALEEDPDNPTLLRLLHQVYMQQFRLIQAVHNIDATEV